MKWWIVTLGMGASAVVFSVILVMWAYAALDNSVSIRRTVHGIALVPNKHRNLDPATLTPGLLAARLVALQDSSDTSLSFMGFRYVSGRELLPAARSMQLGGGGRGGAPVPVQGALGPLYWAIVIPYWFLLLLSGAGPAWWFWSFRRQRYRVRNGLCLRCGYDLREAKEKCPECGEGIRAKVAQAAPA